MDKGNRAFRMLMFNGIREEKRAGLRPDLFLLLIHQASIIKKNIFSQDENL